MAKPFLRTKFLLILPIGITAWQSFAATLAKKSNPPVTGVACSFSASLGGRGPGDRDSNDPSSSAIDMLEVDGSDRLTSNLARDDFSSPDLLSWMPSAPLRTLEIRSVAFDHLPSTAFVVCGNTLVSVLSQPRCKI